MIGRRSLVPRDYLPGLVPAVVPQVINPGGEIDATPLREDDEARKEHEEYRQEPSGTPEKH